MVAADVYSVAPHTGRGGWSWYTGSAGWMYRLIVESLLGLTRVTGSDGARLVIEPCLPAAWPGCTVHYRHHETLYEIEVEQVAGAEGALLEVDGVAQASTALALADDRRLHRVRLRLPVAASRQPSCVDAAR